MGKDTRVATENQDNEKEVKEEDLKNFLKTQIKFQLFLLIQGGARISLHFFEQPGNHFLQFKSCF